LLAPAFLLSLGLSGCGGAGGGGGNGNFAQEFEKPEAAAPVAGDPSASVEALDPRQRREEP
jgi:hypothetical protein